MKALPLLFVVVALAACSDRPPAVDAPAPAEDHAATTLPPTEAVPAHNDAGANAAPATPPAAAGVTQTEAGYLGRWTGVEGMYLVVASKPGGGVTLDMQWDLDKETGSGSFNRGKILAD